MEKLNKIEKLKDGRLFCLLRDDNVVIGVTNDVKKIPQIISEEYCGVDVKIDNVSYQKHDYTYEIKATLKEDGEENDYDFTLAEVVNYTN